MPSLAIPSRRQKCSLRDEAFSSGDVYFSCLLEKEGGFERKDYCSACFHCLSCEQKQATSVWQGTIPVKKTIKTRDEKLERLLSRLVQDLKDSQLAFVLAQAMVRKKQLIKIGPAHYEFPSSGEVIAIKSAHFSFEEGEKIKERLTILLNDAS